MARRPPPTTASSSSEDEAASSSDEEKRINATPDPQTPTKNKEESEDESGDESQEASDDDDDEPEPDNKKPQPSTTTPSKPASESSNGSSGSGSGSESDSESDSEAAKLVTPISSKPMAEPPAIKRARSANAESSGVAVNGGGRSLKREFPLLKEAVTKLGNRFATEEALKLVDPEKAWVLEKKLKKQKVTEIEHHLHKMDLLEESIKLVMEGIERGMD